MIDADLVTQVQDKAFQNIMEYVELEQEAMSDAQFRAHQLKLNASIGALQLHFTGGDPMGLGVPQNPKEPITAR